MLNQNNLNLIYSGFSDEDRIIDSYELIKGILVQFEGQASFDIKVDNTLPIIKGDLNIMKETFTKFIEKVIQSLNGYTGKVNIINIKSPRTWVFAFQSDDFNSGHQDTLETSQIDILNKYTIEIPY